MTLEISTKKNSKLIYITGLTLLTGTLDAIAAILTNADTTIVNIFKYIASGVHGAEAFSGGMDMVWLGIGLHYLIALLFCTFYFLLHPMFYSWFRNNFLTGVVYGIVAWFVMSHGVVPLSHAPLPSFTFINMAKACAILIVCLGLPVSYISTGYYFIKPGKLQS